MTEKQRYVVTVTVTLTVEAERAPDAESLVNEIMNKQLSNYRTHGRNDRIHTEDISYPKARRLHTRPKKGTTT